MQEFKAKRLAYLYWFLLGAFGSHRFYLGHRKVGYLILGYTVAVSYTHLTLPTNREV